MNVILEIVLIIIALFILFQAGFKVQNIEGSFWNYTVKAVK